MKVQGTLIAVMLLGLAAIIFFVADTFRTLPAGPTEGDKTMPGVFMTWPGDEDTSGVDVALDGDRNIYVVGTFREEPGINTMRDSQRRLYPQVSLVKINNLGEQEWLISWPGDPCDVVADKNGNVYVAGIFEGVIDFDPSDASARRGAEDSRMVFLSKFDRSGEFEWVRTWGESRVNTTIGLAVDDFGSVCIGGTFARLRDADITRGWRATSAGAGHNIFIHKFDSSGNTQWRYTGPGYDFGDLMAISADNENNVYLSGCTIDPSQPDINASGGAPACRCGNIFLIKFTQFGEQLWTNSWPDASGIIRNPELAAGSTGHIYLAGEFTGDIESGLNPDALPSPRNSKPGAFVACFNSAGETIWLKTWRGSESGSATGVAADPDGDVYVVGFYNGTASLQVGDTAKHLESKGSGPDAFFVALSPDGDFKYVHSWGGSGSEFAHGVAVDSTGHAFVTGEYHGTSTADFTDSANLAMRNGAYLIEFTPEG